MTDIEHISFDREAQEHGLGELLRHLVELIDSSSDGWYEGLNCNYRARYTPVMRALTEGPLTVKELQQQLAVTQGAVSQTIKLMANEQLIEKQSGEDARQTIVRLSVNGKKTLTRLQPHWDAIFESIRELEHEIGLPLMASLRKSVTAFEQKPFADRIKSAKTALRRRPSNVAEKNYFQQDGELYTQHRPHYPPSLAASLAELNHNRTLAVDVGCGNGQLTSLLTDHFENVVGIDTSQSQLEHAVKVRNASYSLESAECIDLPDGSVDLVTAAQSAHWLDLDRFYSEVRRIGAKSSIIALISYSVPYIEHSVNTPFQRGYWQDIHAFWPPARRHVEFGYADLNFPFQQINLGTHTCRQEMTVEALINYIRTWSAYELACRKKQEARFHQYFEQLRAACIDADETFEVVWPISIKAGYIHK